MPLGPEGCHHGHSRSLVLTPASRGRRATADTMSSSDNAAQPLQIGSRVRIQLRRSHDCQEAPHFPEEHGMTGRVVHTRPTSVAPGHPYLVMFDEPLLCSVRGGSFRLSARHCAADELELL